MWLSSYWTISPNRMYVAWASYLTTASQGLASCGRFTINVEKMKNNINRHSNLPHGPHKLSRCPPSGVPSQTCKRNSPDSWIPLPTPSLHSAESSYQIQCWLHSMKMNRPPLTHIEPAILYDKEILAPLLPGLSRENKMKSYDLSYWAQLGLSLTSGPSARRFMLEFIKDSCQNTTCFSLKALIPAQKFLNQKQWLTVKFQIKEIKLSVPIAFADLGFGFISSFSFYKP